MKKILLFLFILLSHSLIAQKEHLELYKSLRNSRFKSDINIYYNPLMDHYDIHFVKLDIEVSDQSTFISGNATIHASVIDSLAQLILDFSNYMTLDSIFINNIKVAASHSNNTIKYNFDTPLNENEEIVVQTFYHGTPYLYGGGVTHDYDSQYNKNVTWTLSESFHAMEWWPCKQVLSDKIDSTYMFLTCDNDCMVGSNGILENIIDLPDNKRRFEWKTRYPMNYYLLSFAVAEYQDYSIYAKPEGADSVLIQNFVYDNSSYLPDNKPDLNETIDLVELFSEKFGLYPFANEKYGHCLTTLGGGMEHQTMSTMGNFGFNLVAHELGHMWFGDYVTCATWQDIWINEGFASYTEYVALENLISYNEAQNWMLVAHDYALNQANGSIYIPFEEAFNENRIFNYNLSYKKGASLLHIIRSEINSDDLFFASIRNYLSEYADSVATGEDFKNSLEAYTGMEFDSFFVQWYYGKGYPRFDINYVQYNDTLHMTVTETGSSSETPLFQVHVEYKLIYNGGDTTVRLYQSDNIETFKIPINQEITNIIVDPDNWILDDQGSIQSPGNDESLFGFKPNPATENIDLNFNLKLFNKQKQVRIFDLNGRLIKTYEFTESNYPIDISFLSKGIYLLKGSSENKSYTYKLIKQ